MAYSSGKEPTRPTPARQMGREIKIESVDGKTPERQPLPSEEQVNKYRRAVIKDFASILMVVMGVLGLIASLAALLGPWGGVAGGSVLSIVAGFVLGIANDQ